VARSQSPSGTLLDSSGGISMLKGKVLKARLYPGKSFKYEHDSDGGLAPRR
jgi:hypothetical protein